MMSCTAYRDPEPAQFQTYSSNAGQRAHMLPIGSSHPCFPGAKHKEGQKYILRNEEAPPHEGPK